MFKIKFMRQKRNERGLLIWRNVGIHREFYYIINVDMY